MKTQTLSDGTVLLDLTVEEHHALSRSLKSVMGALEPCQLETAFGESVDFAYEFQFSVYLREAAARTAGVSWLLAAEVSDSFAMALTVTPIVDIRFDADGALWRVSERQLSFVNAIVNFHSGRYVKPLETVR
ncbi:MAG: hypothetical protein JWN80_103 [Microbacteriaceae bacterium]|nr:hypothetical protein [Microbacteriaceae bacterium]